MVKTIRINFYVDSYVFRHAISFSTQYWNIVLSSWITATMLIMNILEIFSSLLKCYTKCLQFAAKLRCISKHFAFHSKNHPKINFCSTLSCWDLLAIDVRLVSFMYLFNFGLYLNSLLIYIIWTQTPLVSISEILNCQGNVLVSVSLSQSRVLKLNPDDVKLELTVWGRIWCWLSG